MRINNVRKKRRFRELVILLLCMITAAGLMPMHARAETEQQTQSGGVYYSAQECNTALEEAKNGLKNQGFTIISTSISGPILSGEIGNITKNDYSSVSYTVPKNSYIIIKQSTWYAIWTPQDPGSYIAQLQQKAQQDSSIGGKAGYMGSWSGFGTEYISGDKTSGKYWVTDNGNTYTLHVSSADKISHMSYGTYPVQTWSFTITYNKAEQTQPDENTSVSVTKKWSDPDESHDPITVHLLANNMKTNKTLTLGSDNNWKGSFTPLDKNDSDGNAITYTVSEDKVTGYEATITGDAVSGFTITNTKTPPENKRTITIIKKWVLDNGGKAADSVTVQINKNGTAYRTVELNAENNWTYSESVASGTDVYTATELTRVDGFNTTVATSSDRNTITITNDDINPNEPVNPTPDPRPDPTPDPTPVFRTIQVHKNWITDNGGTPSKSVTVQINKNGAAYRTVELNAENNWTYSESVASGTDVYTATELTRVDGFNTIVTTSSDGNTITVTNDDVKPNEPVNPQTPDDSDTPANTDEPDTPEATTTQSNPTVQPKSPVKVTVKKTAQNTPYRVAAVYPATGDQARPALFGTLFLLAGIAVSALLIRMRNSR